MDLTGKHYKVSNGNRWLVIHKSFLRWKKTEDFKKWKYSQFLKQGGTCYYCDTPLNGVRQNVEHLIPKSKGGSNDKKNLVLACSSCNKEKNTSLLSQDELLSLRKKNNRKRGTYHLIAEEYKSEYDIGLELRQMFRED